MSPDGFNDSDDDDDVRKKPASIVGAATRVTVKDRVSFCGNSSLS